MAENESGTSRWTVQVELGKPAGGAEVGPDRVLESMTGFGAARREQAGRAAAVEVRSLNNRYLKVVVRGDEPYPMYEAEIERVVRRYVRRGTITVHISVERPLLGLTAWPVDTLKTQLLHLRSVCQQADCPEAFPHLAGTLLLLPGVLGKTAHVGTPPSEEWTLVEATLEAALEQLGTMRRCEGRAMADELLRLHQRLNQELNQIQQRLPQVKTEYAQRLRERVRQALQEVEVTVEETHLLREIALFAERSDVTEEVARLQAHLDQFASLVQDGAEVGRKLEFLVQEMGREANTLGAKAADVLVSRHVVEIKALLEKARELVQNVE
ncbi:MAG: YicC family protein [Gemmataceae bacterium]|nr:YicC family protein [Gemmataceae bacterium]MDW8243956.1 YicC/YloC family endoribonuclease [Thermogemmata sp.]